MASAQELLHEQSDLPAAQPGEGPKKKGRIKFPKLKRKLPVKRLIALALAAGAVYWLFLRPGGGGPDIQASYTAAPVTMRDIVVSVSGTGTVTPADSYKVGALVTGEILEAPFAEGDRVEKGALLYRVDPGAAQTALDQAQLNVRQAQLAYNDLAAAQRPAASLAGVVQQVHVQRGDQVSPGTPIADIADLSVMTLTLPFQSADATRLTLGQSATVTLDGTMETLNATVESVSTADLVGNGGSLVRQVKLRLHNPGALSPDQSATARVGDIACAAGGKLQANSRQTITAQTSGEVSQVLVTAGSRVAAGDALAVLGGSAAASALENAAITLENARLNLQSAQDALNNYTITAPISGTVVEKSFKAGDKIESEALSAANGTLATLYDMSQLTFRMSVNELDINKVAVGQQVEITTEALSGQTFTGTVDKVNINGTTTNGFTTYPITIRLDGDGTELARQGLRPGMNVSATIIGQSVENALCVPVGAVSRGNKLLVAAPGALAQDGTTVIDPTKTEERQVALGASDDSYVQILSGLSQGETVLVPDQGQDQVQIQPDGSAAMADSGGEG